jgi:hypothetical protein
MDLVVIKTVLEPSAMKRSIVLEKRSKFDCDPDLFFLQVHSETGF